jgi:hypothetical protein
VLPDLSYSLDPVLFAATVGFCYPDDWQAKALRWTNKRAIWNCARQAGKSTVAALVGLHTAVYYPGSLVLLVSPSLRQSQELFRKVAGFVAELKPKPLLPEDNKLSCEFSSGSRIVSLPSSEATIRGFSGAALIIEDEAARVPDELYFSVRPMLAVSGGRLILMSTPFGKRGHFFREWTDGGKGWARVLLPAVQCPRIPQAFLAEERASMGDWWYQQEYECKFTETTGAVFSHDLIMSMFSDKVKPLFAGGIRK